MGPGLDRFTTGEVDYLDAGAGIGAWIQFAKFEVKNSGHVVRAREMKLSVLELFERFVQCHLAFGTWIRYAKFEVKNGGHVVRAREVYERVAEYLADDEEAEKLFVAFTEFEDQCKDIDRASCVYKFALDCILKVREGYV
ncbi:hypothetical protein ACLB2K_040322 [Fragaria x ananassa]